MQNYADYKLIHELLQESLSLAKTSDESQESIKIYSRNSEETDTAHLKTWRYTWFELMQCVAIPILSSLENIFRPHHHSLALPNYIFLGW